jgi:hypothetical protein
MLCYAVDGQFLCVSCLCCIGHETVSPGMLAAMFTRILQGVHCVLLVHSGRAVVKVPWYPALEGRWCMVVGVQYVRSKTTAM